MLTECGTHLPSWRPVGLERQKSSPPVDENLPHPVQQIADVLHREAFRRQRQARQIHIGQATVAGMVSLQIAAQEFFEHHGFADPAESAQCQVFAHPSDQQVAAQPNTARVCSRLVKKRCSSSG